MTLMLTEAPATVFATEACTDFTAAATAATTPEELGDLYLLMLKQMRHLTQDTTTPVVVPPGTGFLFNSALTIHAGSAAHRGVKRLNLHAEVQDTTRSPSADVPLSTDSLALYEANEHLKQVSEGWAQGRSSVIDEEALSAFVNDVRVRRKVTVFSKEVARIKKVDDLPRVAFRNGTSASLVCEPCDYVKALGY